jgi:hypothetical protein
MHLGWYSGDHVGAQRFEFRLLDLLGASLGPQYLTPRGLAFLADLKNVLLY